MCVVGPIPRPGGRHRPIPTNPPCRPLWMEPDLLAQRFAPTASPPCHPGHVGHWPQARAGEKEGACIHSQRRLETWRFPPALMKFLL